MRFQQSNQVSIPEDKLKWQISLFFSFSMCDSINHVTVAYLWSFLWSSQCISTGRVESDKDNFDVFLEGVLFLCENVK